jgi:hypothetical protein
MTPLQKKGGGGCGGAPLSPIYIKFSQLPSQNIYMKNFSTPLKIIYKKFVP